MCEKGMWEFFVLFLKLSCRFETILTLKRKKEKNTSLKATFYLQYKGYKGIYVFIYIIPLSYKLSL